MTTTESDLYYDPYDFEIDSNPYRVWMRLRAAALLRQRVPTWDVDWENQYKPGPLRRVVGRQPPVFTT